MLGGPKTFAIIGCGAKKLEGEHPAGELYCGHLFMLAKEFCLAFGLEYLILSSLYGLLDPTREIASYDLRISELNKRERETWARLVVRGLRDSGLMVEGSTCVFLAGQDYLKPIQEAFELAKIEILQPLKGLGIGQQRVWLGGQIDPDRREAATKFSLANGKCAWGGRRTDKSADRVALAMAARATK